MRISVIERLEEYLYLNTPNRVPTPPPLPIPDGEMSDSDSDDTSRRPSPIEPEIGMWVDQCKLLFLWYYDIYMVFLLPGEKWLRLGYR